MLYWTMPTPSPWPVTVSVPVRTFLWPAATPRANILLTHGFGEYSGRYHRLITALNDAGYSVYTYDHRGHGHSEGPRAVNDVALLVQDHIALRESLRALPLPLFAFGHSLGGLVTAASYLQDPRGVAGVVLSSPALLVGVNEPGWLKAAGRVLARVAPALPLTVLPTGGLSRVAEEVTAYEQDPQMYHGKVPVLTAISMLNVSEGLWAKVPAWTLPTLIVHGDADKLTDVNGSRRFAKEIASTDRTYTEVPGGYHELFNDTVRDEMTSALIGWLNART
ncbi:hydrolase [Deinococcus aquiradiocola]|uniref:Hydrolase n=2 Tax=Deinococcus aquiradiocola TaxID=393059 RepID=A0A917P598_9DEIO|nr:hydrolase [Deinococcus aquiradiocola]